MIESLSSKKQLTLTGWVISWAFYMLVSSTFVGYANADVITDIEKTNVSSAQHALDTAQHNQVQAKRFGLSVTEWEQYEAVMQSSQGWEMQKSHPLAVLGRTATTQDERERFARLLVKHEYQLTEGLLSFNRARTAAWKSLYPNLPIIKSNTPERVIIYASSECNDCSTLIQQWRSKGSNVDIYLIGNKSDLELRKWAMRMGIRKRDVDDRYITLNHDDGSWLTVAQAKPTPVSMAKNQAGVWSFVTP